MSIAFREEQIIDENGNNLHPDTRTTEQKKRDSENLMAAMLNEEGNTTVRIDGINGLND